VLRDISLDSRSNIRVLLSNLSRSVETVSTVLNDSQKDIIEIMRSFRKTAKTMDEISTELKRHPLKFLMKGDK